MLNFELRSPPEAGLLGDRLEGFTVEDAEGILTGLTGFTRYINHRGRREHRGIKEVRMEGFFVSN